MHLGNGGHIPVEGHVTFNEPDVGSKRVPARHSNKIQLPAKILPSKAVKFLDAVGTKFEIDDCSVWKGQVALSKKNN